MDPSSLRPKAPSFLSDLGKATLRGIRKCPRCGTFNGTRGLVCKNKTCGAVFRRGARRQQPPTTTPTPQNTPQNSPPSPAAVRILTGSRSHLFSVRRRERGGDSRCFVELGVTSPPSPTAEGTPLLTPLSSSRCYLPSCLKVATTTTMEEEDHQCCHIKLALGCQIEATPLPLKSSVLDALPAPPETKETLWQLATQPTGPLVQRVTKTSLVVKCQPDPPHGLGYLHASFPAKGGNASFSCSCTAPQKGGHREEEEEEEDEEEEEEEQPPSSPRCIHFFACLCAFASDDSLAQEFAEFLACDAAGALKGVVVPPLVGTPQPVGQAGGGGAAAPKAKKRKKDLNPGVQTTLPLLAQDPALAPPRRTSLKKPPVASSLKRQGCNQLLDESQVSLSFQEWLASVTERIHQTMHYQFEGKPEPLVFHIPQAFFEALQQRISSGSAKKRLPNSTTAFVRKDALPLGTFSKYTWHITNVLQVKQIFDTPELPLEITRSFIQNRDGSYELFRSPKVEVETIPQSYGPPERQPIRPLELKTFLKVGHTSPTQKEPTPFIIEWIPNILPRARVGELRIKFQYGHRQPPPRGNNPPPPPPPGLELPPLPPMAFP